MGTSDHLHALIHVCPSSLADTALMTSFLYSASHAKSGQATVFAASFVLISVGSAIITLNALLLGGTLYASNVA